MSLVTALAHACLDAHDLDRTQWFYCDVLGFQKQFDFIKDGERFGFYVCINDRNYLEFFRAEAVPEDYARQRIRHLCLEVEDIDQVEKALADQGVPTRGKKIGADNSWQLWCQDPSGVDIEFHQYTERSSQRTGADCVVDW